LSKSESARKKLSRMSRNVPYLRRRVSNIFYRRVYTDPSTLVPAIRSSSGFLA